MSDGEYQKVGDEEANSQEEELPITPKQPAPVQKGTDYLLQRPSMSTNVLHVYNYDINLNRFKPYKMAKVKRSDNFPQERFNEMLDNFTEQGRPPRIDRISYFLIVSIIITVVFCITVVILEKLGHSKALTVLLWMIALVPCGITSLMCMVYCVAYMTVYGRRNSLNLMAELRNRQIFNPMGINVVFSQNLRG